VASLIYLDTHVVAWLYAYGGDALPNTLARRLEESDDLRISPMVRLELQYLHEIGRTSEPALAVIDRLESVLGLSVCKVPFSAVVLEAEGHYWTRDPFDRLIVAQASVSQAPLATRDRQIHDHYSGAIWD